MAESKPAVGGTAASADVTPAGARALADSIRAGTLGAIAHLDDADLERSHSPIMSPLAWDLAHIACIEDYRLCHRFAGLPLLRPDIAHLYDSFQTPRRARASSEAGFLDAPSAIAHMDAVRARTLELIGEDAIGGDGGFTFELVMRHELQHRETMLQTMALAGLLPDGEPPPLGRPMKEPLAWLRFDGGESLIGAPAEGFAYDNERPAHRVMLAPFQIADRPLSRGELRTFADTGGYSRRELWDDAGWHWLDEQNRDVLLGQGAVDGCLCHVSWYEAQALARFYEARLPSEEEWEHAARGGMRQRGMVWEWTADEFSGYSGFAAFPYREYSEAFFDCGYRVLRGGSWATDPRVATLSFRNWDLPQRRQIFAGVRLARDI